MASLLRQIVAGPRSRHPEANLDLCYVTDNIIATSGPSATYPSLAYRNPLSDLVTFLDSKHGDQWCLFEFRAEGCGYPDDQVYGRIWHWPWPDHHPPPFALVPQILGSMRAWLAGNNASGTSEHLASENPKRVAVVHCKAGKGRSGTMAVSYMMTHQGWSKTDALQRFTERRMRPGFGTGVSIPSQLRWLDYVERWASLGNKYYVERPAKVVEVHVWGLREGVTIAVEGYVEQGKKIKMFHVFDKEERDDSTMLPAERGEGAAPKSKGGLADAVQEVLRRQKSKLRPISRSRSQSPARTPIGSDDLTAKPPSSASEGPESSNRLQVPSGLNTPSTGALSRSPTSPTKGDSSHPETPAGETANVIFRPSTPVQLASSDINLAVERRVSVGYGFSTVTSVAHVWFNCFFEGNGPENYQNATQRTAGGGINVGENSETTTWAESSGVFTIDWDAMDGIKGSSRKGTRAFDKVSVVWRTTGDEESGEDGKDWCEFGQSHGLGSAIAEPRLGESIKPLKAADGVEEASKVESEPLLSGLGGSPISRVDNNQIVAPRGEQSVSNEDGGAPGGVALPGDEVDEDGAEGVRRGVVDGP